MANKPTQTQSSTRKFLRKKLSQYQKLREISVPVYQKYISLTGSLHLLPDYLIIGSMKCGTTSLYEYLVRHPFIKPAAGKEIDYFDLQYTRGINWYRSFFPYKFQRLFCENILKHPLLTGEATPGYIDYPHTPSRIKKLTPNAKFIVLLRNPIDRAHSHHNMNFNLGHDELSFEEAVSNEEQRIHDEFKKMIENPNYFSWSYYWHAYLEHGIYVDKLKRWMEVFPKEQFLILQTEEFQQNTSKVYNQVLKFLGLPQWELEEYTQFKKRVYKKPMVEPSVRKQLIEYFKPHNQRLYDFLGKKFDWDE